ncbi:class I SAM-dependent methyltransferase [Ktedonobacteria bacterium brp13]|nr:class I SAM-dependent methyltransferase [Ktedonobacteria bacterium brp13]
MIQINRVFETILNKHYVCPQGAMGRFVGEQMVRQHAKETTWTVSLADVRPTDHVLEIGFGAGKAIELLAKKTTQGLVYGIDLSATMVKRAKERNAYAVRVGRVRLQQGEAAQLPFEEHHFDKVVSIHTFYWWAEDPHTILSEMFRVLKPGGTLLFTFSHGKVGEERDYYDQTFIEEHVFPRMKSIGFTAVSSRSGPLSRQFKILAVVGTKPSVS